MDTKNNCRTRLLNTIFPELLVYTDGVNTGILLQGKSALIINPGSRNLTDILVGLEIKKVEKILFTHHRRELADGLDGLLRFYTPRIGASKAEEKLFTEPNKYWNKPKNRWHVLDNHIPYHVTHIKKIRLDETYIEGSAFKWHN